MTILTGILENFAKFRRRQCGGLPVVACMLAAAVCSASAPDLFAAPDPTVTITPSTQDVVEKSTQPVQLNANLNRDAGCIYAWSQISGPTALNQGSGNGGPKHWQFYAPSVTADASMVFKVTVTACSDTTKNGSATAIVNVLSNNNAPVASIFVTPTAPIYEETKVTLDGTASIDPDGDALTYLWEQTDGTAVTLSSTTDAKVTFTAPNNASSTAGSTLKFKLTVSDGTLANSTTCTVNVVWVNDPPKASLDCPLSVNERDAFTLDGSKSADADDGIASYGWAQTYGGPLIAGLPFADTSSSVTLVAPSLAAPIKKTTVELTVIDHSGAFDTRNCDLMINDITPPLFSGMPGKMVVEATKPAGADVVYSLPTATDAVDGDRPVTCTPASGSTFALDLTTGVTCVAADLSNNGAEASFPVLVVDTTPPSFRVQGDVVVLADSASGAKVSYLTPTARDIVDGEFPATCTPSSGSVFAPGSTTVSCDAVDRHNNRAATQYFTVTVKYGLSGLLSPFASGKSYKIKSALPLKWQYTSNTGAVLPSAGAKAIVQVFKVSGASEVTDPIVIDDSGVSGYQYDSTTNTWQFNWKTTGLAAGTYAIYLQSALTSQKDGPFLVQLAN